MVDPLFGAGLADLTDALVGGFPPGQPDGGLGHSVFDLARFDHELLSTFERSVEFWMGSDSPLGRAVDTGAADCEQGCEGEKE